MIIIGLRNRIDGTVLRRMVVRRLSDIERGMLACVEGEPLDKAERVAVEIGRTRGDETDREFTTRMGRVDLLVSGSVNGQPFTWPGAYRVAEIPEVGSMVGEPGEATGELITDVPDTEVLDEDID